MNDDLMNFRDSSRIQREIAAFRRREDLETQVMQRHGYVAKIKNMSDDALLILLEERPRKDVWS